ncbi:MAG: DUF1992 domain-containing protein [Gammaproteobacteria bacterium]|nr:MAG: DUF1992 domain-containing protein [Gammaproteobacteria bacterium]
MMWIIDRIAEERIREAMERGEFEGLQGEGKPLELEDLSWVPENLRPAYKLLKNAGFVPPEVETRKEIQEVGDLLRLIEDPESTEGRMARERAIKRLNLLLARLPGRSLKVEEAYFEKILKRLS